MNRVSFFLAALWLAAPCLSADGQWIVFEDSGTDEIGICKADGSARRKLPLQGSSPTWMK